MTDPPLTWLYVSADRPDRFDKAMTTGADVIVLDLEDAVAPAHKTEARQAVRQFLAAPRPKRHSAPHPKHPKHPKRIQVRINDLRSPWGVDDLEALRPVAPDLQGIRIPKVEAPDDVQAVADLLTVSCPMHPLIETARGVEAAFGIASHPAVAGVGLGEADLRSELGITDEAGLAWVRGRLVVAARAAGLPRPAMSVYPRLKDDQGLEASCGAGRALGFLGRTAIHPAQLPIIVRSFLPSEAEVIAATELLAAVTSAAADDHGTVVLADGRFADRAMVELAEQTLALAARTNRTAHTNHTRPTKSTSRADTAGGTPRAD